MKSLREKLLARTAALQAHEQTPKTKNTARLKRLHDLLTRLEDGTDVARRDLQNALTEDEWTVYENANQMARSGAMGERPETLDHYIDLLKKADFFDSRADATPITSRSRKDHLSRSGKHRLRANAETTYEKALEYLIGLLEGADGQIIRQWLDRPVDTAPGHAPNVDRDSMPRVKGSRSLRARDRDGATIFDQRRANKRAALVEAIKTLES